jgi:hypothetical protein
MAKTTQRNHTAISVEAEEIQFNDDCVSIKGIKVSLEGEITDQLGELKVKALPVFLEFFKTFAKEIMEEESKKSNFTTMKVSPQEEAHIN